MKNIFILLLIVLSLHANTEPCKTDVYFGNGVWNTKDQAKDSMNDMFKFLKEENPNYFSIADEDVTYSIKYMHNKPYGYIEDLIETYWQLYVNGQISEGYFTFVTRVLNILDFNFDFQNKIKDIVNNYHLNLTEMYDKYREESFDLKHNVLLVAHSQGNLFGNQLYNTLSVEEKKKFTMVSVGTPASHVLGNTSSFNAPYTTLNGDYLIKSISNSLPSNAGGLGHTFVDSYLAIENVESRTNIMLDINSAVESLSLLGCEKEYDYYRFISYICPTRQDQELVVDIYGTHIDGDINTLRQEEYITSDVRVRAFEDPVYTISSTTGSGGSGSMITLDPTGECPLARDDFRTHVSSKDKNGCSAYTFTDTTHDQYLNSLIENPTIYIFDNDAHENYLLDYVMNNTYSSMYTCSTYNMSSEIQDLLKTSSRYH